MYEISISCTFSLICISNYPMYIARLLLYDGGKESTPISIYPMCNMVTMGTASQ